MFSLWMKKMINSYKLLYTFFILNILLNILFWKLDIFLKNICKNKRKCQFKK